MYRHRSFTPSLAFVAAALLVGATDASAVQRGDMVRIPSGTYRPLYGSKSDHSTRIPSFRIDRDAVTRGEFQVFVGKNPQWRRSNVKPVHAGHGYLLEWHGDLVAGTARDLRRPVTSVSWFAARDYCKSMGKRLPTKAEWEFAAAASKRVADAARDPEFVQQLVSLYATRSIPIAPIDAGMVNLYGVRGMHGLAWEWVEDFKSMLVSHDSRGTGSHEHEPYCASAAIGALDPSNYPAFLRNAIRSGLNERSNMQSLGFRCAA